MLKIVPLGGLGEIGLNMMVFEYQDSAFVIDAGLMFPEDYMLGVDYVIPDMDYIRQNRSKFLGIVLTHAHEDHIGALPYFLKEIHLPIFGTPFTMGVVRNKLEEKNLFLPELMNEVMPRQRLQLGVFDIEFIRVCHSAVDGVGLAIKTPLGLVVHTGDFKISHTFLDHMATDVNKFAQCGEQGVLALLSDSTNVEKEGYTATDQEVGETLTRIIAGRKGRIIVGLFASSISRIQQVIDIAESVGRQVIFNGRSIETSVNIAKSLGYINISEGVEIDIEQLDDIPDDQIVIVTTGSQGEPMAALARMAAGKHKQIKIKQEDTVILSSKFIPGNEKAIAKIINGLYRRGADVIYEKISEIHVSGHAFQEELKLMISLTKPKYFIPIHGEYRHLILHARLAEQVGIPKENILLAENGQIVGFDSDGGKILDSVFTGRVLIDGKGVGDVGRSVLKERRNLSEDGLVVVNMAFDEETGIYRKTALWLLIWLLMKRRELLFMGLKSSPEQRDLRKYFSFTIRRRPVILPFLLEV